jgi:hypothetical protein
MKNFLSTFLLCAFVGCTAPAPALAAGERVTGADLKRAIEAPPGEFPRGFAVGYIAGVFDATVGVHHCTPPTAKPDEIVRMAVERLTANNEPDGRDLLTDPADVAIVRSFMERFPCGGQRAPVAPVNPRDGSRT